MKYIVGFSQFEMKTVFYMIEQGRKTIITIDFY